MLVLKVQENWTISYPRTKRYEIRGLIVIHRRMQRLSDEALHMPPTNAQ